MPRFLTALALLLVLAPVAQAQEVDPARVAFPWKNGPARDSVYRFTDHPNVVHVLEAFTTGCGSCGENAPAVEALAAEYAGNPRVAFLDMGLDQREVDYLRWIDAHHPQHPVVMDRDRKIFSGLKVTNDTPQAFVLDCKGRRVGTVDGYWHEAALATLRQAIADALEVTCEAAP